MSGPAPFPHIVIRASAGTGKTYQLAARFIGLLASGARPNEILATTFTRKAAGEILDRVLFWLSQAADNDTKRTELAAVIGAKSLSQERCRELLVSTLRRLHCLRVGTLDSYFIKVAGSFGQELGLPPGWSIGDELLDAALRDEAIELVLAHGKVADLLTLVYSLTKGAATRSVSQLIRATVGGLLELFRETESAAWEPILPTKGLTAEELEHTLAAIATLEIDGQRMRQARDNDLARARAVAWDEFISSGLAGKVLSGECTFYNKPVPAEMVQLYRRLLEHAKSVLVGQVARQTRSTYDLLTRFADHYGALQIDERALRFSDVTFRLAAAAERLGPQQLAFRLDGGIRHVLLDEFQDTAPVQWRVLRPLAQSVTKSGGSFFCVGDAKQAIYGWRGGVAEIFDALNGELAGLQASSLAKSYRSAQPVIDAVNQVFLNLDQHPKLDDLAEAVQQWQRAFLEHSTARTELSGCVTLETAPQAREDEDKNHVLLKHAAQRVGEVAEAAPGPSIGVLVRTNAAVGRLIYMLRERGLPASEEGGNPLIDSPPVELILSLLKLADHPGDRVARFHLATSPLAKALELTDWRDEPEANIAAARVSRQLRRQLLELGYGEMVFAWSQRLAPSCDQRDLARLQQLVEVAYDYQPKSTLRADDFIRLVETRRITDPTSSDVRVMTIHQAKGLQFDVVFLPELGARLVGQPELVVAGRPAPTEPVSVVCRWTKEEIRQFFPQPLQRLFEDDTRREVTEALCLLYVAMTRAVHALHMIVPASPANERSLPKTFAGLLRATLSDGQPVTCNQTLYEHGDPQWVRSLLREGEAPAEPSFVKASVARQEPRPPDLGGLPVSIRLARAPSQRDRGLERTSPSALEGGTRVSAASMLAARADEALNIGTLVHAWMERIEWLDDGLPSEEVLRQVAEGLKGEIGDVSAQLDGLIARFRKQLAADSISAVLQRSFYSTPANLGLAAVSSSDWLPGDVELEVHRERRFAIRNGDELLAGSIDRLVIVKSRGQIVAADILDFKTDDVAAGDAAALDAKVAFYRPQLDSYRMAAWRLLNLESSSIAARLVFFSLSRVVQVNVG